MREVRVCISLAIVCGLALSSAAIAQTDTLYVTNGDSQRLAIVQGGNLIDVKQTYVRAYPLAVRDTIWIGDYNGAQPNAKEYDLNGVPTGNSAPYKPVFAVDGAVNGDTNYQLANAFRTEATVYSADADWQNESAMFRVTGSDIVGITFDSVSDTLWISDRNNIYQYSLGGDLLSQFAHRSGRGCLAWEPSTDTLWYVTNGSDSIDQYSKDGEHLQNVIVSGLRSNNWGAEFPAKGGGCDPCDANCDGSVDLVDVEPFIKLILGTLDPCNFCTGDVNDDGSIDLSDVEGFLECLLG